MRASFLVPGDLATPTGGYGYARRVLRAMAKQGVEIEHVSLPDSFPFPDQAAIVESTRILEALPRDEPILLDGLAGGALPAEVLRSAPGPVVMLCHHPLALETGLTFEEAERLRDTEQAALGLSAQVVTTSHATSEILARDYGVEPGNLTVAPPGTDPAPRAPANGACRILSVGSLTRRKRHDMLIDALAQHRSAEWTLRIAGPASDAALRDALNAQVASLGLGDRISFVGTLSTAALAAAYQAADLFALASEYEGFGMAYTEAMSHGLPTLGIRCRAVEEATAGGALLADDAGFADALGGLLRDVSAREELAERCWIAAQTFLRWDQTTAILAGALRRHVR